MSDKNTTAHVAENGQSSFAVSIDVSGFHLEGDEPVEMGGGNLAPAPYDYLVTALGECTAMTMRWYARQQNWPLEKVSVEMTHHKDGKTDVFSKTITIVGDQLTPEQRQKLIDVAGKCPVQRTLEGTPLIQTISAE